MQAVAEANCAARRVSAAGYGEQVLMVRPSAALRASPPTIQSIARTVVLPVAVPWWNRTHNERPDAQLARRRSMSLGKAPPRHFPQQREHLIVLPADLAEFDGMPAAVGQRSERRVCMIEIDFPTGRKLIEHRTEVWPELRRASKNGTAAPRAFQFFMRISGLPIGETSRNSLLAPFHNQRWRRQSIKAVVDFARSERTITAAAGFGRIEITSPVFILPAGAADAQNH